MRIHLDTDFGGDPDDACALAMLLGWDVVEIVGITTNLDADHRRAGCVQRFLQLADRTGIPVAAGATVSSTTGERFESTALDPRYWDPPIEPLVPEPDAASTLLRQSIDAGATIVAIGAFTNLARLELDEPGALAGVPVVACAGFVDPIGDGLPAWDSALDFNTQCDTNAAAVVAGASELTLVQLPASIHAQLRGRDLPRLRDAGRLGALLAQQSETYRREHDYLAFAAGHAALADDLVNFHWDPVTAAVAAGWSGARIEERNIVTTMDGGVLRFEERPDGWTTRLVTQIDADGFGDAWLAAVESLS